MNSTQTDSSPTSRGLFRSGFSLIEMLIVVAVLGIVAAIAIPQLGNMRAASTSQKLETDVRTINSAVRAYLAAGGNFDGVTDPAEILKKMKTRLSDEQAKVAVGVSGSFVNKRLTVISVADSGNDGERAVWNPTKQQFEIGNSGSGVAKFGMDNDLADEDFGTEEREVASVNYSKEDAWVWDYEDTTVAADDGAFVADTYSVGNSGADAVAVTPTGPVAPPSANQPPAAVDDLFEGEAGTTVVGNVLVNDSDPEGEAIRFLNHNAPSSLNLTMNGGQFSFTIPDDTVGQRFQFSYAIADDLGTVSTANCVIQVVGAPTLVAQDDAMTVAGSLQIGYGVFGFFDPTAPDIEFYAPSTGLYYSAQFGASESLDGALDNDESSNGVKRISQVRKITDNSPISVAVSGGETIVLTTTAGPKKTRYSSDTNDADWRAVDRQAHNRFFYFSGDYNDPATSMRGWVDETLEMTVSNDDGLSDSANLDLRINFEWKACPIALDLDGDGVISRCNQPVAFDIDGNGEREMLTQWFGPEEGILINRPKGEMDIDGNHLFGDLGGRYADGFEKLQQLRDFNGDRQITESELAGLEVWFDRNGDANAQAGEIVPIDSHGIESIALDHENFISSAETTDEETLLVEDVWFTIDRQSTTK